MPSAVVEINNVTRGCVQFSIEGDGARDAETLMGLIEQQLANQHSALRRGPFASYVVAADLVAEDPFGVNEDSPPATLSEVLAELVIAKRRIAELE